MNVVLITVDSLRADHVGFLDEDAPATPAMDSIAADGFVFENAFANAPYTRGSFPAILTGTYPEMYGGYQRLSEARPYLPERFDEAGYATGGFHSNPHLGARNNYDRGFDHLDSGQSSPSTVARVRQFLARTVPRDSVVFSALQSVRTRLERITGSAVGTPYVPGDELNERALSWLESADEPVFFWLHYMDVHHPYVPHEGTPSEGITRSRAIELRDRLVNDGTVTETDARELKRLYRGEVEFVDRCVGDVLDAVERELDPAETVIVFLADHGEAFGEHGYWGHPDELHDELLHIPLVINVPGEDGGRFSVPASTVDLFPTMATLQGWQPPEQCVGDSLLELTDDLADGRTAFAQASGTKATVCTQTHRLIRYLETDEQELFARTDGSERDDDSGAIDELAGELDEYLELIAANRGTTVEAAETSAEVERRLERLGYK